MPLALSWHGRAEPVWSMLVSRGVEGVVLLPMAKPLDLSELLDWSQFSAVAATGAYFKFTLVTRGAYYQGFSLVHLPVRGVPR